MKSKLLFIALLHIFNLTAQAPYLQMSSGLRLPKDSSESQRLQSDLSAFLQACQKPNEENVLVLESQKLETFVLLDEIKDVEKNKQNKEEHFYKPHLTNATLLKEGYYLIQVAYLGLQNNVPQLKASFTLHAHKTEKGFLFSSPLIQNTAHWKSLQFGNTKFVYEYKINENKVKEFTRLAALFDKKLTSQGKITEMYCTNSLTELLRLIGVEYKLDYNGFKESVFSSKLGNRKVIVLGDGNAEFSNFDSHDLWHDRLSLVIPRSEVNKPVDEGCAYLYGGSWGFTWSEIFKAFKVQVALDTTTNWMAIKENPLYFKTGEYKNSADYIVNALLVEKIEKEKGFAGVWEFLNCGKFEKGNENYYKALEQLTGITKQNYNKKVWELIRAEKQ